MILLLKQDQEVLTKISEPKLKHGTAQGETNDSDARSDMSDVTVSVDPWTRSRSDTVHVKHITIHYVGEVLDSGARCLAS